ncbi:MAG: Gfo/Idh/MocA family protein [Armatimonadota bacterium]
MKVAIIGCGKVARGHIRAWQGHPEAEIAMLVDVAEELAYETREECEMDPQLPISTDYREALARADIDIVDICTPSHLHAEQIIAALQAGKHIVTEKPTGYTLEECRLLRYHRMCHPEPKVAVAYSLRYYPVNVAAHRLVSEGAIGEVFAGQFTWNHPMHGERPEEGIARRRATGYGTLSDLGGRYIPGSEAAGPTHVFDLARYFMGDPEEVFACRRRYGITAVATFPGGGACTMVAGVSPQHGSRNPTVMVLQGTEGTIHTVMNQQGQYTGTIADAHGERPIEAGSDTGHGDRTRTENVLGAILRDEPLICPLEEGISTSEFLHAIWDSYNLGIRVPVHTAGKTG